MIIGEKGIFCDVFAKLKDESHTLFYDSNPFIKTELSSWWEPR